MISELRKRIVPLVFLVVILGAILLTIQASFESAKRPSPGVGQFQPLPQQTPPSAAVLQQLSASKGFQYLVAYTGQGFQPKTLTIKKGQTIRFVDNTDRDMWIAAVGSGGDQVYPGTSSCGASDFDSCQALHPADFWEFTFNSTGTWHYQNNTNTSQGGVVIVQ